MKRICAYSFLVLLFFSSFVLTGKAIPGENKTTIQLFFTSDVYGYLKPCG